MKSRALILTTITILAIAFAAVAGWYVFDDLRRAARTATASTTSGTADIGGTFELVDHTGTTITNADFRGKYMLVFFGYTFCPDICPTTLQRVALALDELGTEAAMVQPLFISIDPARDSPAVLAEYVAAFHPSVIGLTGTQDQISKVAKLYRAYFAKVQDGGSPDDDTYLMDHTVFIYLMDKEGEFLSVISHDSTAEEIAATVKSHIQNVTS